MIMTDDGHREVMTVSDEKYTNLDMGLFWMKSLFHVLLHSCMFCVNLIICLLYHFLDFPLIMFQTTSCKSICLKLQTFRQLQFAVQTECNGPNFT